MCTNGVNTQQLKDTVAIIDDQVALSRRWTHKMYHLADNGQMEKTAAKLQEVQRMFDDIRAELDELQDIIDKDDSASGVSVNLVQALSFGF